MTREELKRHCLLQIEGCEMWAKHNGEEPTGRIYEEYKLILELLEQESCKDCISRAEALKVVDDMDIPEDMSVFEIKSHIGVEIGTLPPVTSTQKKGKWEQYGDFWKEKYRCSECKEEQPKILCGEQIIRLWSNYCPHCGAKMQEVEE